MSEVLLELASQCEAATGPDRELDGAIDRLLHIRPNNADYDGDERAFWRVNDGWSGLLVRYDGYARGSFCAAEYTASLDAAMTLVPEGMDWSVGTQPDLGDQMMAWGNVSPGTVIFAAEAEVTTEARTAPLALTAAALRARATLNSRTGDQ